MVRCDKMREKIAYYDEFQNYDYIVAEMGVHYQVGLEIKFKPYYAVYGTNSLIKALWYTVKHKDTDLCIIQNF